MKGEKVLFSSASDNWATPQDFFDKVQEEFGPFDLDACASAENAKCDKYFTKEDDGLSQKWEGNVWCNPPYGRGIGDWVRKANSEGVENRVVMLLPARTDTRWWHDFIWDEDAGTPKPGVSVRHIKGRLKFGGSDNSAPFPSALVIFHPLNEWKLMMLKEIERAVERFS